MANPLSPVDTAKSVAAKRACDFVASGMKVGLGTGSTAAWLVKWLGARVRDEGLDILCVPTSTRTADLARTEGIGLVTLDEAVRLDVTIDGADEFDANLNLVKGGGGALLHEKIVAAASERMVVIADATKRVESLGAFPLPVEVIPFGWQTTQGLIEDMLPAQGVMGDTVSRRIQGGEPFRSDEGNFILDLHLLRIDDPERLAFALNQIPGVVENGLFIDMADIAVIGHGDGRVEVLDLAGGTLREELIGAGESPNAFSDLAD